MSKKGNNTIESYLALKYSKKSNLYGGKLINKYINLK